MSKFLKFIDSIEQEIKLQKESVRTNKFNIKWQIVRTDARDIKDPGKKLSFVLNFLKQNPNKQNYDRVLNWVKMTGVAYKGDDRAKFEKEYDDLKTKSDDYDREESDDNDLSKISTSELKKVYNDLSKRKYGFQYKSVPKDHTQFMAALEKELKTRENS